MFPLEGAVAATAGVGPSESLADMSISDADPSLTFENEEEGGSRGEFLSSECGGRRGWTHSDSAGLRRLLAFELEDFDLRFEEAWWWCPPPPSASPKSSSSMSISLSLLYSFGLLSSGLEEGQKFYRSVGARDEEWRAVRVRNFLGRKR